MSGSFLHASLASNPLPPPQNFRSFYYASEEEVSEGEQDDLRPTMPPLCFSLGPFMSNSSWPELEDKDEYYIEHPPVKAHHHYTTTSERMEPRLGRSHRTTPDCNSRRLPTTHFSTGYAIRGVCPSTESDECTSSSSSSRCVSPTFSGTSAARVPKRIPRKPVPSMHAFHLEEICDALNQLDQEEERRRSSGQPLSAAPSTPGPLPAVHHATQPQRPSISIPSASATNGRVAPSASGLWASSCSDNNSPTSELVEQLETLAASTKRFSYSDIVPHQSPDHGSRASSSNASSPSSSLSARLRTRLTSFDLPLLQLPHLPTLFPSGSQPPYKYAAEPTPPLDVRRDPLERSSSPRQYSTGGDSSSSASSSSANLSSTPPTSAPSSPRPSIVRMFSGSSNGRKLFGRRSSYISTGTSDSHARGCTGNKLRRKDSNRPHVSAQESKDDESSEDEILHISLSNARRGDDK